MPALILTARSDLESKVENFQAGADDYVVKPVAMAELAIRVQALLRRGPALQENILRAADLEINRLTRQVRRDGKRIELSPKEYSLLEYLFLHSGRTLVAQHDRGENLGPVLRRADQYRRCLYRPSAPQDRRGPRATSLSALCAAWAIRSTSTTRLMFRLGHLAAGASLLPAAGAAGRRLSAVHGSEFQHYTRETHHRQPGRPHPGEVWNTAQGLLDQPDEPGRRSSSAAFRAGIRRTALSASARRTMLIYRSGDPAERDFSATMCPCQSPDAVSQRS